MNQLVLILTQNLSDFVLDSNNLMLSDHKGIVYSYEVIKLYLWHSFQWYFFILNIINQ